jgi:hypothetical protein
MKQIVQVKTPLELQEFIWKDGALVRAEDASETLVDLFGRGISESNFLRIKETLLMLEYQIPASRTLSRMR